MGAICLFLVDNHTLLLGDERGVDKKGQRIYAAQCASCHGESGQGNPDGFAEPLTGDLSVAQLASLISKTMPDEDPNLCLGDDAQQVARFVFDTFYSPQSPRRANAQARIALTRLTVRQYRESVADLIGLFGQPLRIPKGRGLQADYFAARNYTENRRLAKQIDDTIDFGDAVPHFDPTGKYESIKKDNQAKKDANLMNVGFSVFWFGGVIAPRTGSYDFVVESKNGFSFVYQRHSESND